MNICFYVINIFFLISLFGRQPEALCVWIVCPEDKLFRFMVAGQGDLLNTFLVQTPEFVCKFSCEHISNIWVIKKGQRSSSL